MFNVGDIVTIRPDLHEHTTYHMDNILDTDMASADMVEAAGTRHMIESVRGNGYTLMGRLRGWNWVDEMFVERQIPKAPRPKAKTVKKPVLALPSTKGKVSIEESVKAAIEEIKSGEYGGTYLKMELEGHLDRNPYSGPWDDNDCYHFIRDSVSQECLDNTVYSTFVEDGSVDSEFGFTVPLSWKGLGYALEYIKAFKLLSKQDGLSLDVGNAGMHITILRSEDGDYPEGNGSINSVRFENFATNMNKLMPALLLLASEDHKSRGLGYRMPRVGKGDHGSAVDVADHGGSGCLEWRVFETCYDHPEMLFDFICVIAKGLRFYHPSPKPAEVGKIGKLEYYDSHREYGLHKYFQTEKHLTLLSRGLPYLLPDHRTIGEVKQLHNFKVTRATLEAKRKRIERRLEDDFDDYRPDRQAREERYIRQRVERHNLNRQYENELPLSGYDLEEVINYARREFRKDNPVTRKSYLRKKLNQALTGSDSPVFEITI